MFEAFANIIISMIEKETEEKIKFFIGGSRRFGWYNKDSDIDIFIYTPSKTIQKIDKFLISEGFSRNNDTALMYETWFLQFSDSHHLIHINITDAKYQYSKLKSEHDKLEKFLEKKSELKAMIKSIKKEYNIKGKDIYRLLRTMI